MLFNKVCLKCNKPALTNKTGSFICEDCLNKPEVAIMWETASEIIPFHKVQYLDITKSGSGAWVIMDGTTWNNDNDAYNNAPWLTKDELADFIKTWKIFINNCVQRK